LYIDRQEEEGIKGTLIVVDEGTLEGEVKGMCAGWTHEYVPERKFETRDKRFQEVSPGYTDKQAVKEAG